MAHNRTVRLAGRLITIAGVVCFALARLAAQTAPLSTSFRVFLADGTALSSYGDAAQVGDRLVFNLAVVGADRRVTLQLMSLPVESVDLARTARYRDSMRARYYAATRGEVEYQAMTDEVERDLAQLSGIPDRKRQLMLAELARQRLQAWPRDHFNYRAEDVRQLAGLFNDVITEIRIAAGESTFSLDLSAGPAAPPAEPLLDAPGPAESVDLAIRAARAADIGEERVAILRAVLTVAEGVQRGIVQRELNAEIRAGARYDALAVDLRKRAAKAAGSGRVRTAEGLASELRTRDDELGRRRPQIVRTLAADLALSVEAARTRRAALDHYAATYRVMMAYEQRVRPAFAGVDALRRTLEGIRDRRPVAFDDARSGEARLRSLEDLAARVEPPVDLAAVHATLASALAMAREACARQRQAGVTPTSQVALQASSAAAGALLLADRARADLVSGLYPPRAE